MVASEGLTGFLWWLSSKEPACQCRIYGFDPWVGKIPWSRKWQPIPVFLPMKSHGQRSMVRITVEWSESDYEAISRKKD